MILSVLKRARDLLDQAGVEVGARTLVGCSGGPDSTVVADVAAAMAAEGRLGPVTLVYIDHGLRDGTDAEAREVRTLAIDLARRAAVDARVESVEVDRAGASLEAAARDARFARLEQVADDLGAGVVLLGHTASDQAETVLMRILRGTGITGLAGIPLRRERYVRPLLGISRVEVETYLAERGYGAVRDPMNHDHGFKRVRIRHELLPRLREENPRIDDALVRLAAAAREQREVLDFAAWRVLDDADRAGPVVLSVGALMSAPPAVAKRAIVLAVGPMTDHELSAGHLSAVLELCRGPTAGSRSLDLPGLRVTREYDRVRLEVDEFPAVIPARPLAVDGPGGPYGVRTPRPGDRMRPERLKGRSRKLSDLYVDAKIPRRLREQARVVVRQSDGEIVWAEHLGRAFGSHIEVRLTRPEPIASNKC